MNARVSQLGKSDLSLSSGLLRLLADVLGKLWASPYTMLGLCYGLCAHVMSCMLDRKSSIRLGNNAIQIINCPAVLKGRAITLGNVILYGRDTEPWRYGVYGDAHVNLGRHEQAHTYQYQLLGPLFVLVYCLWGGANPDRNRLERAAQHFGSGSGSWWRC